MNKARKTVMYAIEQFADDHVVHMEARTLCDALGDDLASEVVLDKVTLKGEREKFEKARKERVDGLRRDRAKLLDQIGLKLGGFTQEHVVDIDRQIQDALIGRSVMTKLYPVTCGRLRELISQPEAKPAEKEKAATK